jgi:hypothetical protein
MPIEAADKTAASQLSEVYTMRASHLKAATIVMAFIGIDFSSLRAQSPNGADEWRPIIWNLQSCVRSNAPIARAAGRPGLRPR